MATIAAAELAVQLSERYTEFLRTQTPQQLADLASGKLVFASVARTTAVIDTPPKKAAAKKAATSPKRTTTKSPVDAAQIADQLRALETIDAGEELVKPLTVAVLKDVGQHLGIRPTGKTRDAVIRQVLNQAIGARSKYAGLRAG